ncbi:MAG: hypothetical protein PT116_24725 [Aphanizomenon gracile PMC638.10]|nr:hypothetical protein [Aphanizomenon gracile PMC638.10]
MNSDRHGAYNWVSWERTAIMLGASATGIYQNHSERTGVSAELGTALVKQQEKLLNLASS